MLSLIGLIVREAGKTFGNAVGEVREAVDFLRYYAAEARGFANDTLYSFKDGAQTNSRPFVHPLLVLGFDIYFMPLQDAIAKLKQLKFDLSILREDTWQGRPVYVVGAKAEDLHSSQFWIDKENLYFVRMLAPAGKDGTATQETQSAQEKVVQRKLPVARLEAQAAWQAAARKALVATRRAAEAAHRPAGAEGRGPPAFGARRGGCDLRRRASLPGRVLRGLSAPRATHLDDGPHGA